MNSVKIESVMNILVSGMGILYPGHIYSWGLNFGKYSENYAKTGESNFIQVYLFFCCNDLQCKLLVVS